MATVPIDQLTVNTIRTLAMDAVQAANSGHPGTPMALAPVGYALWTRFLRFDPELPVWANRDRFVLSAGHASTLLYALLHIAGVWQAATFNRPGFDLFDYDVFAIAGDGCLMEGIGAEAASLAGHLKLSNLCWFYDNNKITIEGSTSLAFSEDVPARFAGLGWAVQHVTDANDLDALSAAIEAFKAETFLVPDRVKEHFAGAMAENGGRLRREWEELFARYSAEHPDLADQLNRMQRRTLPDGWDADLPEFPPDPKGIASRDSGGKVLNAVAGRVPWMIGGSSDLAPSNKSRLTFDGAGDFSADDRTGRNLHFGVREHAAAAVGNGLALSKLRAFQAGFLIFSDFQRGALRLSALMELPLIHVYTHDSIGVGEDGPTHQPIEQIASIRAMPGVIDMRPADANEVVEAWRVIMPIRHEPVALALSPQPLATLDRSRHAPASGVARGAYV